MRSWSASPSRGGLGHRPARAATPGDGEVSRCCPLCRRALAADGAGRRCAACDALYPLTAEGQHDFRLGGRRPVSYERRYLPLACDAIDVPLHAEEPCPARRNAFRGAVPEHLTADQISYIPAGGAGEVALDLGCGSGLHREVIEALGYVYHGVDIAGRAAADLVDAHALPYGAGAFDLVLSIAVLEHLADPLLALAEIRRVLGPARHFIGTVAFQEPFHDDSFFHFSHLGLWHALASSGFAVETILCIRGWDALRAHVEMGFGARLPRALTRMATAPFAWAAASYAFAGRHLGRNPRRHGRALTLARHAGGFYFVARRVP